MGISRNACSLLALPDFPEFAQAVRYGVPGTPANLRLDISFLGILRKARRIPLEERVGSYRGPFGIVRRAEETQA